MVKKEEMKNESKVLNRLANEIEMQGERLKLLIDKFYPDGIRVEFASVSQVSEYIMSLLALQRVSENTGISEKFSDICEKSYETANGSVHISFGGYYNFNGYSCIGFNTCIVFKASLDGTPVYLKDELQPGDARPMFLVDGENKEAYLVMDNDGILNWKDDAFIKLSEFHAILYRTNPKTDNGLCFMINFSQEEEKYSVERIFDSNMCFLENLLMADNPNNDNNTSNLSISNDTIVPSPSNNENNEKGECSPKYI